MTKSEMEREVRILRSALVELAHCVQNIRVDSVKNFRTSNWEAFWELMADDQRRT